MSAKITLRDRQLDSCQDKILKILNRAKLNKYELIYLWGLIGYHIGQSAHPEKNLTSEQIEEKFQEGRPNPPVTLAMMAQARQVIGWIETIKELDEKEIDD